MNTGGLANTGGLVTVAGAASTGGMASVGGAAGVGGTTIGVTGGAASAGGSASTGGATWASSASSTAADAGSGCPRGPGGFCYYTWSQSPTAVAELTAISASAVTLHAQSSSDGVAGLVAAVPDSGALDLTTSNELWFDASIPVGTPFTASIGRGNGAASCTWDLVGRGQARYTVDLASNASGCWPTACGFVRNDITSVNLQTFQWGTNYVLDLTLTDVGFTTATGVISPTTTAADSGIGVNGWCWSLYFWSDNGSGAAASWATPPAANSCHVKVADTSNLAEAGASAELPEGQRDWSDRNYLVLGATVSLASATGFDVQLTDVHSAFCKWTVTAVAGSHEYQVPLGSGAYCGKGSGFDFSLSDIRTVAVGSDWTQAGSADIEITELSAE